MSTLTFVAFYYTFVVVLSAIIQIASIQAVFGKNASTNKDILISVKVELERGL